MPTVPQGAKKPTDRAAKAEAKRAQFIEIDHNEVRYIIDRDNADNIELMEFVEDGKYITAIKGYIGDDQWERFKDANRDEKGRVRSANFEPFLQAVMNAIGGGEGN